MIKLQAEGLIEVACAGHPAPIIISNSRAITIESQGMLPGLLPDISYKSAEYQLEKGERLGLFTDGLFTEEPCGGANHAHSDGQSTGTKSDLDYTQANAEEKHKYSNILLNLRLSLDQPIKRSLDSAFSHLKRSRNNVFVDDTLLVLLEPML